MPIATKYDEARHVLHVTVTGTWPTLPEIIAERSKLIMAGAIHHGVVELVDARGVTKGIPNLAQMQAILHAIGKPPFKRALVVSSSLQLGAGKIAELLDPKGIRVFRDDEAAALKWLLDDVQDEPPVTFDRSRSGKIAVVRRS